MLVVSLKSSKVDGGLASAGACPLTRPSVDRDEWWVNIPGVPLAARAEPVGGCRDDFTSSCSRAPQVWRLPCDWNLAPEHSFPPSHQHARRDGTGGRTQRRAARCACAQLSSSIKVKTVCTSMKLVCTNISISESNFIQVVEIPDVRRGT